jgi:hypothetical protein
VPFGILDVKHDQLSIYFGQSAETSDFIVDIERCWAALENYWRGTILGSVEVALRWAANMKWNGFTPIVELLETVYQNGVMLSADQLAPFLAQWQRSEALPQWDITIVPT